jgi:DNA-binding response OmpR family regulator
MKKRILLADDDRSVREALGRVLESENYDIVYAESGRETASQFMAELPDLVLLDITMPDRDGWDVYDLINSTHPLIPVIVITARPDQFRQASELGVDALMEKPLDLPLLLKTIEIYLAETGDQRVRRLTRPDFETAHLNPRREFRL